MHQKNGYTRMAVSTHALERLHWDIIISEIKSRCQTKAGQKKTDSELEFSADPTLVQAKLEKVSELRQVLEQGNNPDFAGFTDIKEELIRASKHAVLSPTELTKVARCIDCLAGLRNFISRHRGKLRTCSYLESKLPDLRGISAEIHTKCDPQAGVRSTASRQLERLTTKLALLHQKIKQHLEKLIHLPRMQEFLQENYYTIRDDRYVVPIRSEKQNQFRGIIHGFSQTHATVFMEPESLVNLNNNLKFTVEEIEEEKQRILLELSSAIAQEVDTLLQGIEAAAEFDCLTARARFAMDIGANRPKVGNKPGLELFSLKHPLLLLKDCKVVKNDIVLPANAKFLVLSGPNAGGKSVTLSAVALCTLMTSAGVLPTCSPDSTIWLPDKLYFVAGNLENIQDDLSTFTGHLKELNKVLTECGEDSLVLIDELMVGTDPASGAALAAAYLSELQEKGAIGMVATHYETLKALAVESDKLVNASVGFNFSTMAPNYQVTIGLPGQSNSLEIARRIATPESVVKKAEKLASAKVQLLERAIEKLHRKESELEELVKKRKNLLFEAEQVKKRYSMALQQISANASELIAKEVQKGLEHVAEALEVLRQLTAAFQKGKVQQPELVHHRKKLIDIRIRLREKKKELERTTSTQTRISFDTLKPGTVVYVKPFGATGKILDVNQDKGTVKVSIGAMKATVLLQDLAPEHERRSTTTPPTLSDHKYKEFDARIDLRGLTAEEAISRLERYVDKAFLYLDKPFTVIHGHGSGKLRQAVRNWLASTKYPVRFRPGQKEEGGDGVTIVEFG